MVHWDQKKPFFVVTRLLDMTKTVYILQLHVERSYKFSGLHRGMLFKQPSSVIGLIYCCKPPADWLAIHIIRIAIHGNFDLALNSKVISSVW